AELGARSELYYTEVSEGELLNRLARRNADLPEETFRIDAERLREWVRLFEAPDADELRPRDAAERSSREWPRLLRRRTNRWTRAAGACFSTSLVQRRLL